MQAQVLATFPCPFCAEKDKVQRQCQALKFLPPADGYGVTHEQPYCAEFDKYEPDEFMRACRIKNHPETVS